MDVHRPTQRNSSGNNQNSQNNNQMQVGIADDQAKDFDFEKTEMKYDSTGMFHWSPAKNLEDCILVSFQNILRSVIEF
jgi:potassium large conductance calcium-activated channel subfamily M alpha member 1